MLTLSENDGGDDGGDCACHPLTRFAELRAAADAAESPARRRVMLAFADPCSAATHPGWALRNLTVMAAVRWRVEGLQVLCVRRPGGRVSAAASLLLTLKLPPPPPPPHRDPAAPTPTPTSASTSAFGSLQDADAAPCPPSVGWEVNAKGRAGPRVADLGSSMDPTRLASQAVDLNLKLMRWRLLPQLDAAGLASTKCLLLGAGTLGCAVARCLLGWGVRHVTFVDSGKVSYSNPVRQSLFEFADCLEGGKPKAQAAADSLVRIFPGVAARGVRMSIPMPGHPVSNDDAEGVLADVAVLDALVEEHDVVYLLTDTRESRWLPTLLCADKGKLLINAALGFDSYLVMRHGAGVAAGAEEEKNGEAFIDEEERRREGEGEGEVEEEAFTSEDCGGATRGTGTGTGTGTAKETRGTGADAATGGRLGCYFCNDVMAPGNSTADRALDQQCTVTRPGLAPIAGALAVEMMVALRHAPRRCHSLPADTGPPPPGVEPPTPLGIVPHQVRGFVANYHQVLFAAPAFPRCTACSEAVVGAYRSADRDGFLLKAFADPTFLENSTGLTTIHEAADAAEWVGDDSDEDDF